MLKDPRWTMKLEHCFQEPNRATNFLANIGLEQVHHIVLHNNSLSLYFLFCLRTIVEQLGHA